MSLQKRREPVGKAARYLKGLYRKEGPGGHWQWGRMEGLPKGTRAMWESLFRARVCQGRPCHGHQPGKDSPLGSGLGAMGPGALGICCLVRKNITSGKAGLSKQEGGMGTSRSGRGSSRRGPGQHCSDEAARCLKGLSRKEGLRKEQCRCGHWQWGRSFHWQG